ncbi:hypothetical protein ACKF11_07955 [Methylobacillus sp. Pita2]|uniref:hypothetical protein n=1 Tax=Methylobacillus sp. Pita2 TaxID=3383245 RepID=UPI0038B478B4
MSSNLTASASFLYMFSGSTPLSGDTHSLDSVNHTVPTALSQDPHAVIFKVPACIEFRGECRCYGDEGERAGCIRECLPVWYRAPLGWSRHACAAADDEERGGEGVTGLVVIAVCFLLWRLLLNPGADQRPSSFLDFQMQRLVTACRGDKEKARRLVEYERKLNPNLRTGVAIQNAIDRLEKNRS